LTATKRKKPLHQKRFSFLPLLFCKDKVAFHEHVDEVDYSKEPTPTDEQEHKEYNNVQNALRSKCNGQSYKTFANPTNKGKEQENCFDKRGLFVKPFVKSHISTSPFLVSTIII
jgi:hypothetical protein